MVTNTFQECRANIIINSSYIFIQTFLRDPFSPHPINSLSRRWERRRCLFSSCYASWLEILSLPFTFLTLIKSPSFLAQNTFVRHATVYNKLPTFLMKHPPRSISVAVSLSAGKMALLSWFWHKERVQHNKKNKVSQQAHNINFWIYFATVREFWALREKG